jgi:23S rRNA pseudouridine2605 synthase
MNHPRRGGKGRPNAGGKTSGGRPGKKASPKPQQNKPAAPRSGKKKGRRGGAAPDHRPRASGPREPTERLHKALARAGVASRRKAEVLITDGKVRLNDELVTELGMLVDPLRDTVTVDGRPVRLQTEEEQEKVYFLLNKPPKTLTTTRDDRGRQTVLDLVAGAAESRIFPVGRLDFDTEGALLLTNDGNLAHRLTHPRYSVPKTYLCKVKGRPSEDELNKLRRGIYLDDGPTRPADVEVVDEVKNNTWVEITVSEGRNRLVKRMFWRIRHPVMRLIRVQFGGLRVDDLPPGRFRALTKKELHSLRAWTR